MFKFNPEKLADKEIGHGELGTVYPYRKSKDDKRWVVKCVDARNIDELAELMQPVVLGFNQHHPNILPIAGYTTKGESGDKKLYIKMPRMKESLATKIDRYRNQGEDMVPLEEVIAHFYDSVKALEYLENRRISHQDLKPGNILIDHNGKVMISDIGMMKGKDKSYVAPELESHSQGAKKQDLVKADVWSLGVIMIELCLLDPEPMGADKGSDQIRQNIKVNLDQINRKYGNDLANLLARLVKIEPEMRPSFKEIRTALESQYVGLDRVQGDEKEDKLDRTEESIKQDKESKKSYSEEKKEPEREQTLETASISHRTVEDRDDYEALPNLEPIKKELQEKWEQHFKFEPEEQWAVTAKNPSQITDVELDIFLFDASELLKANNVTDIRRLVINFTNCNQISNTGMIHIANHIASNFSNVNELKLDFGGCDQINDAGMTQLVNQISQQLTALQRLTLDFSYWIKITDAGINNVSAYLVHFSDLRRLKLNFNYTTITDQGVAQLATEIANNQTKLEHLTLNFGGCLNVTDAGLTQISSNIGRQLPALEHLSINVSFCTSITDVGVMHFASNTPRHLRRLKHLALDFGGCSEITDKGVTSLATHIAHDLKSLQRLTLDFQACTKVSDKPKKLLKQTLSFIPDLHIN